MNTEYNILFIIFIIFEIFLGAILEFYIILVSSPTYNIIP